MKQLTLCTLCSTIVCFFGANPSFACDYPEWEPHQAYFVADPLYLENSCLQEPYPGNHPTGSDGGFKLILTNRCTDPINITPTQCDSDCEAITIKTNQEVSLHFPGIIGLEDGQSRQDIYRWSNGTNEGSLTLTSKFVKEPDEDPCALSLMYCSIGNTNDSNKVPTKLLPFLIIGIFVRFKR